MNPPTTWTGCRAQRALFALAAIVLFAAACSSPETRKQRYLESGNARFEQGDYAAAVIEYRNAIQIDARFGLARKQLAEAYTRTGDTRGAFDEFVRAADLLPEDADVQVKAGNLLLGAGKPEEAIARAGAALKVQPDNVDALVLRGNALAGLSSFDDALAAIEQAIKIDPERGATYMNLGLVEMARGRRSDAESALRRAVELSPEDSRALLALGNFYWAIERVADAEQAFEQALTLEPQNEYANRFMASLKFTTGRRADAERYLRRIADSSEGPDGTLALADYYLVMGRPHDAVSRLRALKNGGDLPVVKLALARAHAAADERERALVLVEEVLLANAKDTGALLLKGEILFREGRRAEAFDAVRAASAADPSSADAQFALAKMYAARGDASAAQAALERVLRIEPTATRAQVELAALESRTTPQSSVRRAEDAVRGEPDNLTARLALVRSLITARDLARAERELGALRSSHASVAGVHAQDARLALLKNDIAGARRALERAEQLDPRSFETLAVSLAVDLADKEPDRARSRLQARLQDGETPELLLLAANTYLTMKDYASAERALQAAAAADPNRTEPHQMLGSMYLSQQKLDDALREFEALSARQARPVEPLTTMGMILERQGKRDLAKKRYEEALAIDSRAGTAANNLAWMLADANEDLDRALSLAQEAVAVSPETPQIIDTLGWVYYKKGLGSVAIPYFQKAISLESNNGWYHYHLGLAYLQVGDAARGRGSLEQALKLGTNNDTANAIRQRLAEQ